MEENKDFPAAVIDTSFLISALFSNYCDDESKNASIFIEEIINQNGQLFVPPLFWYEIENVLLTASKPKKDGSNARLTIEQTKKIIENLNNLPISTDILPDSYNRNQILTIAQENKLTYYDASYLELANRLRLPLKTFDSKLLQVLNIPT